MLTYETLDLFSIQNNTIQARFEKFHQENPHVLRELIRLAERLVDHGQRRLSINQLFEVLRFETALQTRGDHFKLNNSYRSFYVRLINDLRPDLGGRFEMRRMSA